MKHWGRVYSHWPCEGARNLASRTLESALCYYLWALTPTPGKKWSFYLGEGQQPGLCELCKHKHAHCCSDPASYKMTAPGHAIPHSRFLATPGLSLTRISCDMGHVRLLGTRNISEDLSYPGDLSTWGGEGREEGNIQDVGQPGSRQWEGRAGTLYESIPLYVDSSEGRKKQISITQMSGNGKRYKYSSTYCSHQKVKQTTESYIMA